MTRPPFTSSPPSQPSPYRYLGRGGSERPVKLQIIIALVAGLILVAVPLYLWRRPRPEPIPSADAAVVDAGAPAPASTIVAFDAGATGLSLGPFTTIKCERPGPGKTAPEACDHVTTFEDALSRAVRDCYNQAPSSKSEYTVSYVLETDFRRKKLQLFTGKSSTVKREKAKDLLRCAKQRMPTPDWSTIPHQYTRYKVSLLAKYPVRDTF